MKTLIEFVCFVGAVAVLTVLIYGPRECKQALRNWRNAITVTWRRWREGFLDWSGW